MPSTPVHDALTVAAAAVSVPVYLHYSPAKEIAPLAFLVGGIVFSGLLLSADLDIDSKQYRRWGVFRVFWWPYQKLVPHRSWVSHNFLIGPLLRAAYLLLLFYGLVRVETWVVDQWIAPVDRNRLSRDMVAAVRFFLQEHRHWAHMAVLGLVLGAFIHTAADTISSGLKRKARRMRRLW